MLMGINTPWTGGTRTHVLSLAKALLASGHRLKLVTDPGVLEEEMTASGIPFERRAAGLPAMLELLSATVERDRPDVLHAHPHEFILESYLLAAMTGIPVVVTIHGEYLMHLRRDSLGRRIAGAVSSVIAVSERVRDYLINNSSLTPDKIRVVPNGIDTEAFRPGRDVSGLRTQLGLRSDELIVMYLGRLDADKESAVMATAEAIPRLARRGIPARGVFVGTGNLCCALKELSRRYAREISSSPSADASIGIDSDILINTGFRRDIPDLLSLADVVVATGRSALEALAVGKPVLAAGRAGYLGLMTPELWQPARESNFGDHGLLPKPEPEVLAGQIHRLHRDSCLKQELGTQLRDLVIDYYDIRRVVREMELIYAEACAGRPD